MMVIDVGISSRNNIRFTFLIYCDIMLSVNKKVVKQSSRKRNNHLVFDFHGNIFVFDNLS